MLNKLKIYKGKTLRKIKRYGILKRYRKNSGLKMEKFQANRRRIEMIPLLRRKLYSKALVDPAYPHPTYIMLIRAWKSVLKPWR